MKGYCLYFAAAALSATSLTLHIHWALTAIFHLFFLKLLFVKKKHLILISTIIYCACFMLGIRAFHLHQITYLHPDQTHFQIHFSSTPTIDGDKFSAMVKTAQGEELALSYIIKSKKEKNKFVNIMHVGTTCSVSGVLSKPEKNRNEHLFNYKQYLFEKNVHWILKINQFTKCENSGKGILFQINILRERAVKKIETRYPKELIPYAKALLIGNQNDFDEDIYSLYQRLGIVHLLAISGLHVTLLYFGFFYFLIRIGITREMATIIIILLMPIYAILCGANPPVIRACIMLMLILLTTRKRFSLTPIDGLSISFLLFVLKDPFILYNVGFQLSFIVSFSILLSHNIMSRYKNGIIKLVVISFISQVSSLPIILFQFYQISLISIFSNLIFIPIYSFVLLPLFIFSFLSSFLFPWLFYMLSHLLQMIIYLSENVAQFLDFKWAVLIVGRPGIWMLLLILLAIFSVFIGLEKGKNSFHSVLPLFLVISLLLLRNYYNLYGEIDFVDIGQGDSILIHLPFHQGTYLIDTGGTIQFDEEEWQKRKHPFTVGNDILIPLLKSKGIGKIDKLILTHSDADHIGAANELIGKIGINQAYISPNSWVKPLMKDIVQSMKKEKISINEVKAGFSWENPAGSFKFISPFDSIYEGNNDSLVLFANMGGKRWLFTGDLEQEGEKELMNAYQFDVDVLKVGHHGSKTSSSQLFLEKIHPSIAIISVGKNNHYGHPNSEVLERLENMHIKVFRTDQQGEISYKFKQNKGTFHTILP